MWVIVTFRFHCSCVSNLTWHWCVSWFSIFFLPCQKRKSFRNLFRKRKHNLSRIVAHIFILGGMLFIYYILIRSFRVVASDGNKFFMLGGELPLICFVGFTFITVLAHLCSDRFNFCLLLVPYWVIFIRFGSGMSNVAQVKKINILTNSG